MVFFRLQGLEQNWLNEVLLIHPEENLALQAPKVLRELFLELAQKYVLLFHNLGHQSVQRVTSLLLRVVIADAKQRNIMDHFALSIFELDIIQVDDLAVDTDVELLVCDLLSEVLPVLSQLFKFFCQVLL